MPLDAPVTSATGRMSASLPKATELLRRRELQRWANNRLTQRSK
jgi:hypothetical protein